MQQGRVSWKINFDDTRKIGKTHVSGIDNKFIYQIMGAENDGDKIRVIFSIISKSCIFEVFTVENSSLKKI